MIDQLTLILALGGLLLSFVALRRVAALERRVTNPDLRVRHAPALEFDPPKRPLRGLRIAISVLQDHPDALFPNLLRERLLGEDAAEALVLAGGEPGDLGELGTAIDLLISGRVLCNGYSDIYFEAQIQCRTANEVVWTLSEKPAGGDRPANLALETVTKLSARLEEMMERNERRNAIRELGS